MNAAYLEYRATPGRHVVSLYMVGALTPLDDVFESDTHVALDCSAGSVHCVRVEAKLGGSEIEHVSNEVGGAEILETRVNNAPWEAGEAPVSGD